MRSVDVVVVGSGLCGSLAAHALGSKGLRVLVLEGGPPVPGRLPGDVVGFQRAVAPFAQVSAPAWSFRGPRGYEWHRVRARGGRTLLWGGWMERVPPDYFAARRRLGAPWRFDARGLRPWVLAAERALSVRTGNTSSLHRRLEQLGLAASRKREAVLVGQRRMLTAADLPLSARLQCNAPVVRLERAADGYAVWLGDGSSVRARRVVLAASPIETARIIEASLPVAVRRSRLPVFDHLIAGALAIAPRERPRQHPLAAGESAAVVHPPRGATQRFTLEVRGPSPLEQLDAQDLGALGFDRASAARHSFFVVFAMGETDPDVPRTIALDARRPDALGRPSPRFVRRKHTARESRLARQMNARVLAVAKAFAGRPDQAFVIYDACDFSSGGHEVGTCLGRVDDDGEVSRLPGVFVADGAGLPAATDRHPSLTLAANALRVSHRVGAGLGV